MSIIPTSRVIVDNWSLELVCQLLEGNLAYHTVPTPKHRVAPLSARNAEPYFQDDEVNKVLFHEKVIALLNLLDILVLNDDILYDPEWSNFWKGFDGLNPVRHLFSEIRLSAKTKDKLSKPPDETTSWFGMTKNPRVLIVDRKVTNDIIGGGAVYYYNLANLLGTYYWPSPRRTKFIKENVFAKGNAEFTLVFKEFIDDQVRKTLNMTLSNIGLSEEPFLFSGIGSAILANCDSSESILVAALQFRESKESVALREWLRQLNVALETGNIAQIGRAIKDVLDSLAHAQRKLGIKTDDESKVELQIGLSPSLSFDTDFVASTVERFKPKPLHLVFLREHFNRCLTDANVVRHIDRIFFK